MKFSIFLLCLFFSCTISSAQKADPVLNLGFEDMKADSDLPNGWFQWGMPEYELQVDSIVKNSGNQAMLITPKKIPSEQSFGCAAFKIPSVYDGKEITLEGYMKLENVDDGVAGLLIRVDGHNGPVGFDNMMDQNIHGTIDWKKYSTTVPFSSDAKNIFIGGIASGSGKVWFDDFQVYIDGMLLRDVPIYERPLLPAELDNEFDEGSNIEIPALSHQQYVSLYTLGKIWGFVKYYHPKIATGDINWDYELFRVLPDILEAKNNEEFSHITENWINKLGEVVPDDRPKEAHKEIKLSPSTNWINDSEYLSESLRSVLNEINVAKREGQHFYIGHHPNIGNPEFKNERKYEDIAFTDDGFKLLSLYRYWNMIEYFFPYKHLMDENWEDVLHDFVPKFLNADDELKYKLTTLELIGKIQDTHANIWMQDTTLIKFNGEFIVPMEVKILKEQQVVITRFFNDSLETEFGLKKGDIILKIGDLDITRAINERSKYCPASNRPTQFRDVARRILRTNEKTLNVVIETESGIETFDLPTVPRQQANFWKKDIPAWKLLENNIGYIYPGKIKGTDIDAMMDSLSNTKGIVIDLRCYPSEFIVFSLGKHFVQNPTEFVKFTAGSLEKPGEFTFTDPLKVGEENNDDYYKGKIVILVNETTQSQAEYTTMAFQAAPNATVIGSTTAAADGNVSPFFLPGGIRTMISGIGVYYPDGRETQRIGVAIDEEVLPTVQGLREGKDEVLERGVEIIMGN